MAPNPVSAKAASIVLVPLALFLYASLLILLPGCGPSKSQSKAVSSYHMKQITLALHLYHDDYHCLPAAVTRDAEGRPMHSWRVAILPYLEEHELYEKYDFDQPWDSPHNLEVAKQIPEFYTDPAFPQYTREGKTTYLALAGPKTALSTEGWYKLEELVRGTTDTVAFVQDTQRPVPWTKPVDISPEEFLSSNLDAGYYGGTLVGMADGSVQTFHDGDKPRLKPMVTIDGK